MRTPASGGFAAILLLSHVLLYVATSSTALAQQQQTLGSIIGHVRVARGEAPPERVLVTLEFRGAAIDSVYTDSQGTFGFHNLGPNPYAVSVDDDHYQPARKTVVIEAVSLAPLAFVDITLVEKSQPGHDSQPVSRVSGANPEMADIREYSAHFPKSAVKAFKKGINADKHGKQDDAIRSYERAVQIAPDFYPAHNNLGSDYLSKSDFPAARKEFEQVVQLNQSDAAGYFNLSNVCMLMGQLTDAQQFLGEGMRRQPDSPLGHFLLGSLDIRLGKYAEAETALRQAIQLSPTMAQSRLQLVNLLVQQGRKADAVAQLHDFVNAFPENPLTPQAKQLLQRLEPSANVKGSISN